MAVFGTTSARAFAISRQGFRQLGVLSHFRAQRLRRLALRRVVIVGDHHEQRRLRDQRNLVHDRLAVDQLRRADESTQPAGISALPLILKRASTERVTCRRQF